MDSPDSQQSQNRSALLLLFLPVVLLLVFLIWPILSIFLRSISSEGMFKAQLANLTLENYTALFTSPVLLHVVSETLIVAVLSTLATGVLAIASAMVLIRVSARARAILLGLVIVPFFISIMVRLIGFLILLGKRGWINDVLFYLFGQRYDLLFNHASVTLGMVNYLYPYLLSIVYVTMASVDTSILTAARTLGASRLRVLTTVYLPLTRNGLVGGLLLIFVYALGFFLTPAVLGGPSNVTASVYIQQSIDIFDWGYASSLGIALLLTTLIPLVLLLHWRVIGAGVSFGSLGKGVSRPVGDRSPVLCVLTWILLILSLILLWGPLIVVAGTAFNALPILRFPPTEFSLKWFMQIIQDPSWIAATGKSVIVALGVALLTVTTSLLLTRGLGHIRRQGLRSTLIVIVYSPMIIPVILLGIGNYDIQNVLRLNNTVVGLILAHSVFALPFCFAVIYNAIGTLNPNLELAARSLGASRHYTYFHITVRAIATSLLAAAVISYLLSWDDVVIALFQTGIEKTLPVLIFSYTQSNLTPSVSAVATLLSGFVMGLGLIVLILKRLSGRLFARAA